MFSVHVADTTYLSLSWDEVEEYVSDLAERIRSVYQPDTILAVMKGGGVIGVLLADRLGVGRVYTANIRSYEKAMSRGELDIYQKPPKEPLSGKRVLVVDDIVDSGQSLSTVMQLTELCGASDARSATLLVKEHSPYIPDFYIKKVEGWVFYPWEVREACEEIYSKTGSIEIAEKILISDLKFSNKEVKRILEKLKVK